MIVSRFGRPEVLRLREADVPVTQPGEVLIRVQAAGVNYVDLQARMGLFPDSPRPPFVPGYEVSGTVEVRPGSAAVESFSQGDRVLAVTRLGGYAEYAAVAADKVCKLPGAMSFEEAAALPVVYFTAYHALHMLGHLQPGQRVLIHSAGGALGTAAIQIAKVLGAETFGTASPGKHDALRGIGLQHAIDYRSGAFDQEILRRSGGKGMHFILDPLGGRNWRRNYRLLAPGGRMCVLGFSDLSPGLRFPSIKALFEMIRAPRFRPLQLMNDNRGIFGVKMVGLWDEPGIFRRSIDAVLALYAERAIRPIVDRTFPLEEAAAAHRHIHERRNIGKVLLRPL